MDARFFESQKHRDVLAAYWPRRISPYVTALLVRTRVTPNQTTVLWGVISALNSYVIYRVLTGDYQLLPVIPATYVLTYVLDCVDGEVARVRHMENPVGGKLLDGICHRTTEYSLLAAYVLACGTLTGSRWVLPIGLLLISGEAMYTYAYERRLTTLRVDIGFTGLLSQSDSGMYARGERWSNLSIRRKIATIKGQVHYKSVYLIVALSYVSGFALLAGLALLAAYKHWAWMKLIAKTLAAAKDGEAGKTQHVSPPITAAVANSVQPQ